jgi:hypothetical protein
MIQSQVSESDFENLKARIARGEPVAFKVASGSMAPVIAVGEPIVVAKHNGGFRRFDIVAFWSGEILICHYIWRRNLLELQGEGPVFITKNIHLNEDLPVPAKNILGLVVSHSIPKFSRLKLTLKALRRR